MRVCANAKRCHSLAVSPAEFDKLFVDETEKWGKVAKFAGIKPE